MICTAGDTLDVVTNCHAQQVATNTLCMLRTSNTQHDYGDVCSSSSSEGLKGVRYLNAIHRDSKSDSLRTPFPPSAAVVQDVAITNMAMQLFLAQAAASSKKQHLGTKIK